MSMDDLWRKIQQTFLILKDWYENHELYHKIGYLIASEKLTLHAFDMLYPEKEIAKQASEKLLEQVGFAISQNV